jgi:two-component system, OmpR family, response regulator CpxR
LSGESQRIVNETSTPCAIEPRMSESTSTPRVLVVDDDLELSELVEQYLTARGFAVELQEDGKSGLEKAQSGAYGLIVLDVNLPEMDGFEVLRRLRSGPPQTQALPVVMLTAHGDETDRIVGLELGADDYLPKPFNPRELLARIQAVLRRAGATASNQGEAPSEATALKAGELEVNVAARSVSVNELEVELTAAEFDVLVVLVKNAGRVVTREELAREGMNRRLLPLDRSLDMHISNLRAKLWPGGGGLERLKTVRGVGYLFKA